MEAIRLPISIQVFQFDRDGCEELQIANVQDLKPLIDSAKISWINVDGAFDAAILNEFGELFGLHPLALEDVASLQQRAKVERYDKHYFMVARMVSLSKHVETEQLSIFFDKKIVLTFQNGKRGDCLDPIRTRLRSGAGNIREFGADHLAYAILDAVIDSYFPVLEQMGDRLEDMEEEVLAKADRSSASKVHAIKRDVLMLRRSIWPIRDAVNQLYRGASDVVEKETRVYLRDCLDHTLRIMDMVEMYRELCADLMNLHLSAVSNRMNEVMKILTIVTTLFIPPTLIAGIYGMNFKDSSPWNMPELSWAYGYPFALGLMVFVMVALYIWMKKKGALSK